MASAGPLRTYTNTSVHARYRSFRTVRCLRPKTTRKQKRYRRTLFSPLAENGSSPVLLTSGGSEPLRTGNQNRMQGALLFDPSGCTTELKSSETLDRSRGNSQRKNQAERLPTGQRKPLKSAAEGNRESSGEAGKEFQATENSSEASNPRERGSDPRLNASATSFVMPGTWSI